MSGSRKRIARGVVWTGGAFLLSSNEAEAHLVNTGFGPFYDGLSHVFLTPEDLLSVIALSLLAGLSGPRFGRAVLFALPLCWLIGGLFGLQQTVELALPMLTTLSFLVLGGLVALDRKLPFGLVVGLGAALGMGHGYLNGTAMSQAQLGLVGLLGIGCAVFVIVSLGAALVAAIRADWARIAVRVAGSWIAATGFLALGWVFRSGG